MQNRAPLSAVAVWLFICSFMVFCMAVLGAVTRLTGSGLSMTTWDPVMGAIPPHSPEAWQAAFFHYQQIPQYKILNSSMTLDEFKGIYFWEWLHRLWGRLIGIVFVVPLALFAFERRLSRATVLKFCMIFLLGAVQGFIGWFMVKSGLDVLTSVSPYRLALHLGFALTIYALLLWAALDETDRHRGPIYRSVSRHGWAALAMVSVTIIWGAFTAGFHAGEIYNTWPLMDGQLLPDAATALRPVWRNFLENPAFVQFSHRWLGPTTMLVLWSYVARYGRTQTGTVKTSFALLAGISVLQVALGVMTVLSHAAIAVAAIHQAGALTLLSLLLITLRASPESPSGRPRATV